MLGWFRWLCELHPPIGNHTREQRLLCLRRLLDDLAAQGHPVRPGLILREDFPVRPQYLPRALSPEDDRLLQEALCREDNLYSYALLLMRLTGIRIGECIHLALNCVRHVGPEQWALHVPLGKMHTERLVPLDAEGLRVVNHIVELRAQFSARRLFLQREFYWARHNTPQPYCIPSLSVFSATSDLAGIRHALAATRHLLEMYRRHVSDDKTSCRLRRLDRRLLDVDQQLQNIAAGEK
jgi:integrase